MERYLLSQPADAAAREQVRSYTHARMHARTHAGARASLGEGQGCVLAPELPVLETWPGCYHRTPSLSGAPGVPADSNSGGLPQLSGME